MIYLIAFAGMVLIITVSAAGNYLSERPRRQDEADE